MNGDTFLLAATLCGSIVIYCNWCESELTAAASPQQTPSCKLFTATFQAQRGESVHILCKVTFILMVIWCTRKVALSSTAEKKHYIVHNVLHLKKYMCNAWPNPPVIGPKLQRWYNGDMGIKGIIWCITKFGNYDILAPYSSNNHYLRWIQTKPLASLLLERLQQSSFLLTPKCLILLQLTGGWTGPWWIAHDARRHRVKQSRRPAQQRTRTPQRRGRIPPQSAVSWLRAQANICWMY